MKTRERLGKKIKGDEEKATQEIRIGRGRKGEGNRTVVLPARRRKGIE